MGASSSRALARLSGADPEPASSFAPWERSGEGGAALRRAPALDRGPNGQPVASKLRRDRARRLRRERTDPEAKLWEALRGRRIEGWKWRRQVPVGPFVVDFLWVLGRELGAGFARLSSMASG